MRVHYDPKSTQLATIEDKKNYRAQIEALPVRCDDGAVFDVDDRSEKRMRDALTYWDGLGRSTIDWRLADNTVLGLSRSHLQQYFNEAMEKRAARAFQIYREYLAFRHNPSTTVRALIQWKQSYEID